MTSPDKLIAVALGEVGYLEKASNAYLDDKTRNAGKANYTKYGKWYDGGKYQGQAWCAIWASWCADEAGAADLIPKHYSCSLGIGEWKKRGGWRDKKGYTPVPGDLAYFKDTNGAPCHVEIVIFVTADRIITVGGNTSGGSTVIANGGAVAVKDYDINYTRILGYGHPDWPQTPSVKEDNMTIGEFVASLTDAQAYEIYRKAFNYMAAQEIPEGYNARPEYDAAVADGVTDGTRPLAPATRLETAIMIERGTKRNG